MKVFSKTMFKGVHGSDSDEWINKCDGKTKEECERMGFLISDNWLIETDLDRKIKFAKQDDMLTEIALTYFCENGDVALEIFEEMLLENNQSAMKELNNFIELNPDDWKEFLEEEEE